MKADLERWERKYRQSPRQPLEPDPVLASFSRLIGRGEQVLDVAAGTAHNALYLARRGCRVFAVDGSLTGLRRGLAQARRERLQLLAFVADLDRCPLPERRFDAVVVIRYLNRQLIPALKRALRPGGLLIYRTFNTNLLRQRPAFNADFLLEPGELARLCDGLRVIATNDRPEIAEPITHWVGIKPATD